MGFLNIQKQKLFWDNVQEEYGNTIDDYLIPSIKFLPKWYKNLREHSKGGLMNYANSCPSFIDIFKNSYTVITPCDVYIRTSPKEIFNVTSNNNEGWWHFSTHSKVDNIFTGQQINQLGSSWDQTLFNIKFSSNIVYSPSKNKLVKVMFLPSYYYNPRQDIQAAIGVIDLIPNTIMDFNINFMLDTSHTTKGETKEILIKQGTPIGMLYFPNGILKFQKKDLTHLKRKRMPKSFSNSYSKDVANFKSQNRCPYNFKK